MLLSVAYRLNNDVLTSEKFKALSSVTQLREMGRILPVGSGRKNVPRASQVIMKFAQQQPNTAPVVDTLS